MANPQLFNLKINQLNQIERKVTFPDQRQIWWIEGREEKDGAWAWWDGQQTSSKNPSSEWCQVWTHKECVNPVLKI